MPRKKQPTTEPERTLVRIKDARGTIATLPVSADFEAVFLSWTYVLQRRRGWAGRKTTREIQAKNALTELTQQLRLPKEKLRRACEAERIEVSIADVSTYPSNDDVQKLLYARRIPWEYLLSAATKALGREEPLSITRHVDIKNKPTSRVPSSLLYLESAPGPLAKEYEFTSERDVVTSTLGIEQTGVLSSLNEDLRTIRDRIVREKPDIIHVAGFDSHQASELLDSTLGLDDQRDGLVLRGEHKPFAVADGATLASALVQPFTPPLLIAFNLYNSAAELAAEAVARGAGAAIGFQDEIDDETSEFFFAALYREWRRTNWNLFDAFSAAWRSLHNNISHLHGTGIVLWSSTSAFAERVDIPELSSSPRRGTRVGRESLTRPPSINPVTNSPAVLEDEVLVSVEIQRDVNYALLHNELPLFSKFTLHKRGDGPSPLVKVTVELNVGSDNYPFRQTLRVGNEPVVLADKVKLPLTSSLARALRERVQSTLYVHVLANERTVYEQTVRVTLLPVDEWLDDGKQSLWLPSFVLPRDPAVSRVVEAAQRYLMALQDDPSAGFDGYQQVDIEDGETMNMVDLQVRALWYALSYDFGLTYINPPPAYSKRTQRLRTPSDVISGKRGTCIDLALLLAACLEYIDVYPCVVLLTGHAFPAYWRSHSAHENFLLANNGASAASVSTSTSGSSISVNPYSWLFRPTQFAQIVNCIQRGELVPLETVDITSRTSFEIAMQNGLENMRSKREFDSLLDVRLARLNEPPVTPLPIIQSDH